MQVIRSFEQQSSFPVGFGIRVLLVSQECKDDQLLRRLAGLGGKMEQVSDLFVGLEAMIEDPAGYGLCVIDCDSMGGLLSGRKGHAMLAEVALRIPVILLSSECTTQEFPQDRAKPVVLRAPASNISLRVGFEHALRDRLALRAILNADQRVGA